MEVALLTDIVWELVLTTCIVEKGNLLGFHTSPNAQQNWQDGH